MARDIKLRKTRLKFEYAILRVHIFFLNLISFVAIYQAFLNAFFATEAVRIQPLRCVHNSACEIVAISTLLSWCEICMCNCCS